ncbi:DUF935 domain-containing protein [Salipiger abyssi]|uniref:Mu-like prophage protein gp29 n=1 Tax=Salipiger abyssi TaxID=1250539 RepID=A0A1P8UXM3_9RHOB|nr:DUF935 domain-containing protein [Salipiger abyssi]ALF02112.1 hypothetical protein vBPeaSP1_021 [Pelagibaca phage vB_PeaS-P1]APZ54127.1 Mu-like prophage protein gp29 [Salipiger abyssi]
MALLDQFGRPLQKAADAELLERQAVASLGSVRQIQSGHPADGLTPVRLTGLLRAAEMGDATSYLELAEQMEEKDLHYSAVLGVRKRAIRSLELHVTPGDDSSAAEDLAEMTRIALNSSAIRTTLIDMMDAIGKGYSVCEIVWEREGKSLKIADLEWIDPRWFEFDQENGRHLYLRDNDGPQALRPDSYVIHMSKAKSGLPVRGGLARLAAWAYLFKNYTVKDWSIFCEAYGHPLRLGRYDSAATPQDRLTLLRAVRQIGVDMAAIIPKSMDVEIVNAAAAGSEKLYEGKARWWDEQLSKGVLGQVATTDAIAGGHAVGKIHENVRDDIRDADAEQLAATLQRDVAGALRRVCFSAAISVPLPNIRFEMEDAVDPRVLLDLIEKRPPGLRIATADVYKAFNLRKPDDDEEVLEDRPVPPAPEVSPTERLAASRDESPSARDSIDALIEELIATGEMQEAMDAEIGPFLEALAGASDMDEVQDVLDAFAKEPPSEAFRDQLTRSIFAARIAGEVGAEVTKR